MKAPKIYFETGYLLDSSFERVIENQKTILQLLPVFQQTWDSLGTQFVQAAVDATGKVFRRSELLAYIIMHPEIFSSSHPFLINVVRSGLIELDKNSQILPMKFCELVFHELLHIYLDDNFSNILDRKSPMATPLILKFACEEETVISHLHLYSLQEYVFRSLAREDVWAWIKENALTLHSPGYQKALEIIQNVGYQQFIEELRN